MKEKLSDELESGRVRTGVMASTGFDGMNGFFITDHVGGSIKIMASDGSGWDLPGQPWEHVSVSCETRCPTWIEMDWVKDQFWDEGETVIQFHVPKSDHINRHPYCLHLWKPTKLGLPMPPKECVG